MPSTCPEASALSWCFSTDLCRVFPLIWSVKYSNQVHTVELNPAWSEIPPDPTQSPELSRVLRNLKVLLGPHQILVFECRALQVDDPLSPQRDVQDPPYLDVNLCRTQDHHVVVLHTTQSDRVRGEWFNDLPGFTNTESTDISGFSGCVQANSNQNETWIKFQYHGQWI